MKTLPSQFTNYPWNCVFKKAECEIVAKNIMLILKRTGDVFRELTYEEYEQERKKDGKYSDSEKRFFDQVAPFCKSAEEAKSFSKEWQD